MGSPARGICLDTGLLIQALRDTSPGSETTQFVIREFPCFVTALTVYEVMLGAARMNRDIGERKLLSSFTVLPFDDTAAQRAAQLQSTLIRLNQRIGILDTLIAAICLAHDLPLLTLNARDFGRVPDLALLTPEDVLSPPGD